MKQNRLGRTGLVVSEIGLGSMTFGSKAASCTIPPEALAACDEISREIRYPMG